MNQYLISAFDFEDDTSLERRMKARPLHLDMMSKLKRSDNYVMGGAVLNNEGQMIGSTIIVQFENDQQLSAWLAEEPYLLNNVWERVDVKPFRVAQV